MPEDDGYRMSVDFDVPAVMRDGTTLYADVYRPDRAEAVPVLLMRHPYSKSRVPLLREVDVWRVVRSGYMVVMQDVRGRYTSEGRFAPSRQELTDGVDAVAWAARLPGSNGVVGLWGSSYAAETQWSALLGGSTEVRSIVPMNSPTHSHFTGYLTRGGPREFGNRIGWWHRAISFEEMRRAEPDTDLAELLARFEENQRLVDEGDVYGFRPFMEMAGRMGPVYADGMQIFVEPPDAPWRREVVTAGSYDRIDVPAFITGGWFDCFLGSTLEQYRGMAEAARGRGGALPHLLVGPWAHNSSDYRLGDLRFGLGARATLPVQDKPLTDQIIRWFDATLKGDQGALEGVPPVRLYLMMTNTWLGFEQYPPAGTEAHDWYLADRGRLVREIPAAAGSVQYDYDPEDPAPTMGGPILMAAEYPAGPLAQNALYDRDDVVSFESGPLSERVHVIGKVSASLHVSTDAADSDFVVSLCDVHPDGRSILIANGVVRLSARDSFTERGEYVPGREHGSVAGEEIEVRIDLLDTAYTFGAGHRIRVDVTSSSFPRWDPNLNTGHTIFDSAESVIARQTVRFGGATPSRITLSVAPEVLVAEAVLDASKTNNISNGWQD